MDRLEGLRFAYAMHCHDVRPSAKDYITALETALREAREEVGDLHAALDSEKAQHDETRGYRQKAEQEAARLTKDRNGWRLSANTHIEERDAAEHNALNLKAELTRLKASQREAAQLIREAVIYTDYEDGGEWFIPSQALGRLRDIILSEPAQDTPTPESERPDLKDVWPNSDPRHTPDSEAATATYTHDDTRERLDDYEERLKALEAWRAGLDHWHRG
jgi:hypothetical protein